MEPIMLSFGSYTLLNLQQRNHCIIVALVASYYFLLNLKFLLQYNNLFQTKF